jgi:glucuronate isomerase
MLFVVQVKGTDSDNKNTWLENVKHIFKPNEKSPAVLPTCLFVVNVRDNNLYYAWIAEPKVEGETAKLQFNDPATFNNLNAPAVDEIVGRVRQWYAVYRKQLMQKGA